MTEDEYRDKMIEHMSSIASSLGTISIPFAILIALFIMLLLEKACGPV